jgi:hypothetical protein
VPFLRATSVIRSDPCFTRVFAARPVLELSANSRSVSSSAPIKNVSISPESRRTLKTADFFPLSMLFPLRRPFRSTVQTSNRTLPEFIYILSSQKPEEAYRKAFFPHAQSSLTSLAFALRQQEGLPPVLSTRKLGPLNGPGRVDIFRAHPGALSHESAHPSALRRCHYLFPFQAPLIARVEIVALG